MAEGIYTRIERKVDELLAIAKKWAASFEAPPGPSFPCGPPPGAVTPPPTTNPTPPPPPPVPGNDDFDKPSFDWNNTASWRRMIGGNPKFLSIPAGQGGPGYFFGSKLSGNTADIVSARIVTDGGDVVAAFENANASGVRLPPDGRVEFEGGRTYRIVVDTPGAVLSFNLLRA